MPLAKKPDGYKNVNSSSIKIFSDTIEKKDATENQNTLLKTQLTLPLGFVWIDKKSF